MSKRKIMIPGLDFKILISFVVHNFYWNDNW